MKIHIGRLLITGALLGTLIAPWLADWNASHLFSHQWSPHARFHGAVALLMLSGLSVLGMWALWRASPDPVLGPVVAAAVPVFYWGAFFIAVFVPGTALEDTGHAVARPLGIPANLLAAGGQSAAAIVGLGLHLRFGARRSGTKT